MREYEFRTSTPSESEKPQWFCGVTSLVCLNGIDTLLDSSILQGTQTMLEKIRYGHQYSDVAICLCFFSPINSMKVTLFFNFRILVPSLIFVAPRTSNGITIPFFKSFDDSLRIANETYYNFFGFGFTMLDIHKNHFFIITTYFKF